ncbi:hypothetical protein ES703_61952 [subsurface metagenome]
MRVFSINKSLHEISGIVYQCGVEDHEGDVIEDPAVLQDAAFDFMERYSNGERDMFNVDHDDQRLVDGIQVRESFFTEAETIHKKVKIPRHAWILTLAIPEGLWPLLSRAKGFSMQGYGEGIDR